MPRNFSLSVLLSTVGTLFSRVSGLFRDVALSAFLGTGALLDGFLLAFSLPNMSRRALGEGALSASFVPLLNEELEKGAPQAKEFTGQVLGAQFLILSVLTLVGSSLCLVLSFVMQESQLFLLMAALLPYMIFICISALLSGVLHSLKVFFLPSFSAVTLNLFMILGVALASYLTQDKLVVCWSLVVAVIASGFVQTALLLYCLRRKEFSFKWCFSLRSPAWRKVWLLMIPALFGASVTQLSTLSDRVIATFIGEGSVSSLYFSERLVYLPVGLFGVALATVSLPALSRSIAGQRWEDAYESLLISCRLVMALSLPCAFALYFYGEDLLALIYQRGEFSTQSLSMTSKALFCYLIGVPFFCVNKIGLAVFYAQKKIKETVRVAAYCLLLNFVLGLALIPWLGHASLALATSFSALANTIGLLWMLSPVWRKELRKVLRPILMILIVAFMAFFLVSLLPSTFSSKLFSVSLQLLLSSILYVFSLVVIGQGDLIFSLVRKRKAKA